MKILLILLLSFSCTKLTIEKYGPLEAKIPQKQKIKRKYFVSDISHNTDRFRGFRRARTTMLQMRAMNRVYLDKRTMKCEKSYYFRLPNHQTIRGYILTSLNDELKERGLYSNEGIPINIHADKFQFNFKRNAWEISMRYTLDNKIISENTSHHISKNLNQCHQIANELKIAQREHYNSLFNKFNIQ